MKIRLLLVAAGLIGSAGYGARGMVAERYGHHLLLRAGESRDLGGLGEHLETIHLTDPPAIQLAGETLTAARGGISCMRFRYRDGGGSNEVQTVCAVVFDERGTCKGRDPLLLDLEMFLEDSQPGDANYLAHGEQTFYGSCTIGGRYRLRKLRTRLPPLMVRIIDAYTSGAGADDAELDLFRATPFTTYSGSTLRPSWLVPALGSVKRLGIRGNGTVSVKLRDCDTVPDCTNKRDLVQAGDVVFVGYETPSDQQIDAFLNKKGLIDGFVGAHGVPSWSDTPGLFGSDEIRRIIVRRLIGLELMDFHLRYFDSLYELRGKGVAAAVTASAGSLIDACFPTEKASCVQLEAEVAAVEAARIQDWIDAGFELWWMGFLQFTAQGAYRSLREQAPDFHLFDGVVLDLNLNGSPPLDDGVDTIETMTDAIADAAAEIGRKRKVIISPWAGPMTFYYDGAFCEAEICESDLPRYYALNEVALATALRKFTRRQFHAFAIPLFEGSHLDLRDPHEAEGGTPLNRVGETLFNNPLLNIYLSR